MKFVLLGIGNALLIRGVVPQEILTSSLTCEANECLDKAFVTVSRALNQHERERRRLFAIKMEKLAYSSRNPFDKAQKMKYSAIERVMVTLTIHHNSLDLMHLISHISNCQWFEIRTKYSST